MSDKRPRKVGGRVASKPEAGAEFDAVFYANPKKGSPFRYRATHMGEARAPKAVLSSDPAIRPGVRCRVRIKRITHPASASRGHIEVEYAGRGRLDLGEDFYVNELLRMKLQALLESGMNILLDGPQGSGKTVMSRRIAEALDMEYTFFNCSPIYEATDFLATLQVRAAESGQAETVWTPTDVLRALESAHTDPGRRHLVFLDEFNRCREMARNGIMPALDSTRRMYNPITGRYIEIPDNVQWIAAINNGAQFTGTTSVDPAQLDRFSPLRMEYPPEEDEVRILAMRNPGVSRAEIQRVVRAANAVRGDPALAVDLSFRATEEVCTLLGHPNFADYAGDPVPELLKSSFCARYPGRWNDESTDSGLVWKVIERSLAGQPAGEPAPGR